jgi:hypothetical protein
MKFNEIKTGDTIRHYASGELVTGVVISATANEIKTKHSPVRWGKETTEETTIRISEPHQQRAGYPTTPGAFDMDGNRIKN